MSWALASLRRPRRCALAAGFAWYERARPPSRLVALVADAGRARRARAASRSRRCPNVKPTTDIVLISRLRARRRARLRGRRRRRRSRRTSFFGQGPWTPWQMAAWGAGRPARRARSARVARPAPRAASRSRSPAAPPGLLFGAIMDLSTWVDARRARTRSAAYLVDRRHVAAVQHRPRGRQRRLLPGLRPGARRARCSASGAALARHAGGPPAPRSRRSRSPPCSPARPAAPGARAEAGSRGVDYLRAAQNRDGGFGGTRGEPSTPLYAAWAGIGLAGAGRALRRPAHRLPAADGRHGARRRRRGAHDPRAARVRQRHHGRRPRPAARTCGGHSAATAPGAGSSTRRRSASWRCAPPACPGRRARCRGRCAGSPPGSTPTAASRSPGARGAAAIDVTSGVVQALAAVAAATPAGRAARGRVPRAGQQRPDGGFPLTAGGASNAQSTAFAIQALVAAGPVPAPSAGTARAPPPATSAASRPPTARCATRARRRRRRSG